MINYGDFNSQLYKNCEWWWSVDVSVTILFMFKILLALDEPATGDKNLQISTHTLIIFSNGKNTNSLRFAPVFHQYNIKYRHKHRRVSEQFDCSALWLSDWAVNAPEVRIQYLFSYEVLNLDSKDEIKLWMLQQRQAVRGADVGPMSEV